MHGGMPYDPIRGQGHGASEVPKIALFKVYLLKRSQPSVPHWPNFYNYSF